MVQGGKFRWYGPQSATANVKSPSNSKTSTADTSFGWERYVIDISEKFLSAFIVQLDDTFEQLEFWMVFDILDPGKLHEKKENLIQYGHNNLQGLGEHYGTQKVNRFEVKINAQDADIDTTALTAEWPLLKSIMFKKCLLYHSKVGRDISRAHPENEQELIKKRESYTPQKLWDDLKHWERDLSQLYLPASLAFDFSYQHSLCGTFVFKNEACENEAL